MTWEILWALILGFALSAVVQAVVSKGEMSRLRPDDSPRTLCVASGLGAASSSCSYAAVALARSVFRKGGNFTAAMAFEFASTNLVIELGVILAVLIGWQFTLAEFIGGPLMILFLAVVFRLFIAGALGAWVPEDFWRDFFLVDHSLLAKIWGPLVGPVVSVVSFVCSI